MAMMEPPPPPAATDLDKTPWDKPIRIVHSPSIKFPKTTILSKIYITLARQAARFPELAPGLLIVDCSSLLPSSTIERERDDEGGGGGEELGLYAMWVTRISTPGIFSHSCVGCHLRRQFDAEGTNKLVMSIFNDDGGAVYDVGGDNVGGGEGEVGDGEKGGPGTYLIVFKRVDVGKMRCVPVNFSRVEKEAVRVYIEGKRREGVIGNGLEVGV